MANQKQKVLILGAAGRDFHNFNTFFRDNADYEVVAFTATQIPKIEGRQYPAVLAGKLYPDGIPILLESKMEEIIREHGVDVVVFAYSDSSHEHVMHMGSRAVAAGADYWLMGGKKTMVKSTKPIISVCAARTGCGKSQTSRKITELLLAAGKKVVAVRHPMPYGNLAEQAVQRFAKIEDLAKHKCTVEEMEEYEQYIERGMVIYAGVDYEAILRQAEKEADVIIWDGGNNDIPFYKPDLAITVLDPLRPGHEMKYHPGEANLRLGDILVVNKVDSAKPEDIQTVLASIKEANPTAKVIMADSIVEVDNPALVKGKRVLVVEDGPTLTHGGMDIGAGYVAAQRLGAAEIIQPRPYAVGPIAAAYKQYPHMGAILPALGYYPEQLEAMETTINAIPCDSVIIGTPIDLRRFVKLNAPATRVTYSLAERPGELTLDTVVTEFLKKHCK